MHDKMIFLIFQKKKLIVQEVADILGVSWPYLIIDWSKVANGYFTSQK